MDRQMRGDMQTYYTFIEKIIDDLKVTIDYIGNNRFPTFYKKNREDMYSEAVLAILSNVDNYDRDKSSPATYFYPYILHAMMDYVASITVHTSRYYTLIVCNIKTAISECEKTGIEITDDILSFMTGYTVNQVSEALKIINRSQYEECTDEIPDHVSFDEEVENGILLEEIKEAVSNLPDETETVIKMYYGIDCVPLSERKISDKINISVRQVRNKLSEGIDSLRDALVD